MAKLSTAELIDAFKELTLLELSEFVKEFETTFDVTAAAPAAESATAAQTNAPNGAGVVSETRDGLPALKIYFDVGKSAVSADLANASQAVRAYLHAHPNAHLVVSGYNDPTGNAAANAALSKSRAQNVAAALEKAGVAASAITLEKPADSTSSSTGAESRRVEVAVRS